MSRLRSLQDFLAANLDTIAECKGCGRRVRVDTLDMLRAQTVKWRKSLDQQGSRLRCTVCKHRGARLAPAPKIGGPLDCEEFQADIRAMWERVMAEELTGQCNAMIAEPDGDGLVYVKAREDDSIILACLGTEAEACELMSQWLGSRDYQEND